jgi:branched-chain amino acid transport system ATP-binding protein
MLKTENLAVSYGKIIAVRDVSIHVEKKEIVAIIGANGAGKTTLVNAIMGFVPVKNGKIFIDGAEITNIPSWKRAKAGLAIVPEGGRIFRNLSVKENLFLGAYLIKDKSKIQNKMYEIFEMFPRLKERYKQIAGTLSGGERQMLSIARALMSFPKMLLIDEISMGLMPKLVEEIMEAIHGLKSQDVTILIAEQNTSEVLEIADKGYVIQKGAVVMSGTAKDLKNDPKVKESYLGI